MKILVREIRGGYLTHVVREFYSPDGRLIDREIVDSSFGEYGKRKPRWVSETEKAVRVIRDREAVR